MIALAHGLLLLETGVLAARAEHGGGALLLQHAAIAEAIKLRGQVEHRHRLAAARHQRTAEHLAERPRLPALPHEDGTGQPLDGLLDARRVDTEQHLGARLGGSAEFPDLLGLGEAVTLGTVEMHRRVRAAQERFQRLPDLIEVILGLEHGQIPPLCIGQDTGQQVGGVLGLTHRPADLVVEGRQRVVRRGQMQILDPGAEHGQLAFLRPEHRRIVGGNRQRAQCHGLPYRHPGDHRTFQQIARSAAVLGAVGHGQAQQLRFRAEQEQPLGRLCPACRCDLMIAVKDDIIRLFGCQPDPLLGRRLGQSSAIAEDDVWGKNAVVVAADIRLAQGEPRLAVHQPDKGGLRMVGDQLPRDTAFARPRGMGHRGFSVLFQRRRRFGVGGRIDLIQTERHRIYLRVWVRWIKDFSYKFIIAKNSFLSSVPRKNKGSR